LTLAYADAPAPRASNSRPGLSLRIGYEIVLEAPAPTPMLLMLYAHPDLAMRLENPDIMRIEPVVPISDYIDSMGNRAARIVAPAGVLRISSQNIYTGAGLPDERDPSAIQHSIDQLPPHTLRFLLGSRYCEVDRLTGAAWGLFGKIPAGHARVQAICDWIQQNIEFGYRYARSNKTAVDVYTERRGVCRDFMHLAITFCRAMGIPARYATGYLSDVGEPEPVVPEPMDFSAFLEVFLGGRWWPVDARYNRPRIGRILMARGRDAVDVALTTSFGPTRLIKFSVVTEQIQPEHVTAAVAPAA
jgi:transglutaminase-like putative cysteine protease